MQKIRNALVFVLLAPIGLLIIVLLSPLILLAILIFGIGQSYSFVWRKIRRDPSPTMTIDGLESRQSWQSAETPEAFEREFKKVCDTVATLAKAKKGAVRTNIDTSKGFEDTGWLVADIECTLQTNKSTLELSYDFLVREGQDGGLTEAMPMDEDGHATEAFPSISIKIVKPRLHHEHVLRLTHTVPVWVAVALLRGDVKFTYQSGQLWAYIKEKDVWVVQYKLGRPYYGLRREFTGKHAREYYFDKESTHKPI